MAHLAKHCVLGRNQVVLVGNPYVSAAGGALEMVAQVHSAMLDRGLQTAGLVFHGSGYALVAPDGSTQHKRKASFRQAMQVHTH